MNVSGSHEAEFMRDLEAELTELGRTDPTVGEIQAQIEAEKQRILEAARRIRENGGKT